MFDNILERKEAFLTKINQQKIILESQKAVLDYKKQKVKKVEKSGLVQRG